MEIHLKDIVTDGRRIGRVWSIGQQGQEIYWYGVYWFDSQTCEDVLPESIVRYTFVNQGEA